MIENTREHPMFKKGLAYIILPLDVGRTLNTFEPLTYINKRSVNKQKIAKGFIIFLYMQG
jgi:hypothetical protein